jgi:hypothetical protein
MGEPDGPGALANPSPKDDLEPDVEIREGVTILYRARKILDSITGNKAQVEALWDIVYKTDAELGYAAWQVGVLKGQLRRERRAKAELEARLATLMEALHGSERKSNDG